ncbi:MAG: 2-oxoacid:acceptor oxidoreductase family protein [Candidatus Bathyarchaeota archaeon]|jgi:2-oxoglutarate ferredoxin oxidoreductase subunit gamma
MKEGIKKPFYTDVLMAGFGGQGLMFIGKLLAYTGMKEGKNVTWIPSYGPEMRGGKANCTVVISKEEIASPVITSPHALIIMNNPSLEAFEPKLKSGGVLIWNASLVTKQIKRKDITAIPVRANELASQVGEEKTANMVMLGAYVAYTGVVAKEALKEALKEFLGAKKRRFFSANVKAFEKGMKSVPNVE